MGTQIILCIEFKVYTRIVHVYYSPKIKSLVGTTLGSLRAILILRIDIGSANSIPS